jgi:hypothetical protein
MAETLDPARLPPQQFQQWLNTISAEPERPSAASALTFAPETQAAIDNASQLLNVTVPRDYVSPEGKRLGVRPGVFFNINDQAEGSTRFQMGLDSSRLNQFKYLVGKYGPDNVDINDDGRFILRNQPAEDGGVQDMFVNPPGLEGGDIAETASQAGPMVAGAVGALLGGRAVRGPGRGFLRGLSSILGMAAAQEGTGFVQDEMVRLMRGNELEVGDTAKERAKMALADAGLGLIFAGSAKAGSKLLEGALGIAQIETGNTATKVAQRALAEKTGVKMELSPGQASESKLLLRMEAMAGGQPGTAGTMDRILLTQQKAEDELRRVFLGLPRTMSDDDLKAILPQADLVGERGLQTLRKTGERLEGEAATAGREMAETGTAEAQRIAGVNLKQPPNITDVGATLRTKVTGDFTNFRSAMGARYETFLAQPEIGNRVVSGRAIAKDALDVERQMTPSATKQKQVIEYDQYGGPMERSVEQTERLDAFVESKVKGFIDELKGLGNAKVSVNDLKQIRTSIDNAIAEGVAIPGTDTARLSALRDVVEKNITQSLEGIDKRLLTEWQALKTDYKTGMERFNKVGVREMLVAEGEKGSIGNTALAGRVLGNGDQALDYYNAYKGFFGAGSAEFKALQDAARHDTLFGSLGEISGLVDGARLESRLRNVRPEIAHELFGADKQELFKIAELLKRAKGANVDAVQLDEIVRQGGLTASKLQGLVDAEEAVTRAYNNKLIAAAKRGVLDGEAIKPSEFVKRATRLDPKDANRVISELAGQPDLVQEIRQLGVEELWGRIQVGFADQKRISSALLDDALGNATQRQTWEALIGSDTVSSLGDLVKTLAKRDYQASTFTGAGRLSGGATMNQLFMRGEVGALPELAARALVGFLYSGPLKRSVTNLMTANEWPRLINGVVASTPFVEHLMTHYGTDGTQALMGYFRESIEPLQKRDLFIQHKLKDDAMDPAQLSPDEFKQWLGGAAQ